MRCDKFEDLLHAWMDEALAPEKAKEARAHADACPACAELAAALREALAMCRDMGEEAEVPHAAATAWRRAVRVEAAGSKTRRRVFAMPRWEAWAGLAAGILVLIGGANLVRLGRTSLQPNAALHDSAPAKAEFDRLRADALEDALDAAPPDVQRTLFLAPPATAPQEDADAFAGMESGEAFDGAPFDMAERSGAGGSIAPTDSETPTLSAPFEAQGLEERADLPAAEPETIQQAEAIERTEAAEAAIEEEPEADERAGGRAPFVEFLLDAGLFLALCLPAAAIALGIARLRRRGKKMQNPPES